MQLLVVVAGAAALASGGVAFANAGSSATTQAPVQQTAPGAQSQSDRADQENGAEAKDTDQVQSGDQTAPDTPAERAGSEAVGGDGPGGHADEPGNQNADHQFQGEE
jgi:hypothetical protein